MSPDRRCIPAWRTGSSLRGHHVDHNFSDYLQRTSARPRTPRMCLCMVRQAHRIILNGVLASCRNMNSIALLFVFLIAHPSYNLCLCEKK